MTSLVRASRRRGRWARAARAIAFVSVLACITTASAQHPTEPGVAPAPPPGEGALTVQVVHTTDATEAAGVEIILYALSPDGTPGLANGVTNADGVFEFSNISPDPGIVYLLGARYKEIPFGQRVTFAAGETRARVEIEIMSPTDRVEGVAVEEVRLRVDWMGDRVVVRELIRVVNPGDQVIQLSGGAGTPSIFSRKLDANASDFSSGPNGVGDGLGLEDGAVFFRGPLYPGEQTVEYLYSLPVPADGRTLRLPVELAQPAGRVVVVAGTNGLDAAGPKLVASSSVLSDADQPLASWARAGLAANDPFELELTLPESRPAQGLMKIPRSDVWVEVDDTQLTANVDLQVEIPPGPPVAGTIESPLLRVSIPTGATLQGVAPETEALGLIPTQSGGFDVVGPIGSGTTSVGYSYRMPVERDGVQLDMNFPGDIETLNVLIADTGLALDSSRLHRRRPFRSGTRNYLHREAFNIEPNETVDLEIVPLRATGIPRTASIGLTLAAAAAGALFLFAPLRSALRREARDSSPLGEIQAQREAIYAAIRDLDHDFETEKLEEAEYQQMRDGLRAQAIELLRAERAGLAQDAGESPVASETPVATDTPVATLTAARPAASESAADAAPHQPTTGRFCPSCGEQVVAQWRFCSHCGGSLNPPEEASG